MESRDKESPVKGTPVTPVISIQTFTCSTQGIKKPAIAGF